MKSSYKKDLKQLTKLAEDIEAFSKSNKIKAQDSYALNLCLDEILTNIIMYGLKECQDGHEVIELTLEKHPHYILAMIRDNGIEFNPIKKAETLPDTSSNIANRKVGGLGVFFVDKYMDLVQYTRKNNFNILTLQKAIKS